MRSLALLFAIVSSTPVVARAQPAPDAGEPTAAPVPPAAPLGPASLPAPALTAPGVVEPQPPPAPPVKGYGGQLLLSDGITAVLLAVASAAGPSQDESIATLAALDFVLVPPGIHLAHHRPGRAMLSLALRAGLPLLGARLLSSPNDEDAGNLLTGVAGGAFVAALVDDFVLGAGTSERAPTAPRIAPQVGVGKSGVTFALGGQF
jgi:hypothetical protein